MKLSTYLFALIGSPIFSGLVMIEKDKSNSDKAVIVSTLEISGAAKIANYSKCDGVNKNQPIAGMMTLNHW